jgi:hypothetical protein
MKTNCKFLIFITLASILIMPERIYATDNLFTLGNDINSRGEPTLKIEIRPGGTWMVYRKVGATYFTQMYSSTGMQPALLGLKIGNTRAMGNGTIGATYSSTAIPDLAGDQGYDETIILAVEDVPSATDLSGDVQFVTKKFSGYYNSVPFSVYLKITYDKEVPNIITFESVINADQIAPGIEMALAYGFVPESRSSGTYAHYGAITSPSIMVNGVDINDAYRNAPCGYGSFDYGVSETEARNLVVAGYLNNSGEVVAFYQLGGRPFDRYYAAPTTALGVSYGSQFLYWSYYDNRVQPCFTPDAHLAVGYNYIYTGETTVISTGLMFAGVMPAELEYTWQKNSDYIYSRNLSVPMGTSVSLRMDVRNYNTDYISGVGFRIDMPAGLTIGTPVIPDGYYGDGLYHSFTAGTHNYSSTHYKLTNGDLDPLISGLVVAPTPTATDMYGQWIIDESMISLRENLLPSSGTPPAILTVTTTAQFPSTANVEISKGGSKTFTVELPPGLYATRDITVNISYTGTATNLSYFDTKPATVIIPQGDNSANFVVGATLTAPNSATINVVLSSTDYAAVIIGANKQIKITISSYPDASNIEVSGTLSLCEGGGGTTTLTATSNLPSPTFKWYESQSGTSSVHTGAVFTTPPLAATKTYYVGVISGGNENRAGDRKAVTITVAYCEPIYIPVNPHLMSKIIVQ